ncbi:hypothetical protein [Streptomyces sp. NPDC048172]|uniref:hypothetical protein n=1 Tax=Streptomyces sp. NPDC048172 TaxID=3365505 RepID=UPI0037213A9D
MENTQDPRGPHRAFTPPADFGPGALFVHEPGPRPVVPPWAAVAVLAVLAVAGVAASGGTGGGAVAAVGGCAVLGSLTVPALRRRAWEHTRPDAVGFDARGILVRCDGGAPFHVPWRHVRRLDTGHARVRLPGNQWTAYQRRRAQGLEPDWLRLWLVPGAAPEAERTLSALASWRRTDEDAVLLLRFHRGVDLPELATAAREHAPQGVRLGL